jgi:alpha-D-ribose 1-methylphosphonate 5-triphosphate synthase subunit PhnG
MPEQGNSTENANAARRQWLAVLARADVAELAAIVGRLGAPPQYVRLKGPETGTVMIEGRAGGGGRRFNVGEATVTRAVVQLVDGTLGVAYALGRDARKAELAAVIDAVLQDGGRGATLAAREVAPLAAAQAAAREIRSRKAAATKVDFFTVVRGHD